MNVTLVTDTTIYFREMEKTTQGAGPKNRTNLFIEVELLKKIDHITGMQFALKGEMATRTDIVNEALTEYVERYEKKNGKIPVK